MVTCPTAALATRLGNRVVHDHLAACVNILPKGRSIFRWQGKVERATEVLLLIKTTAGRFTALRRAITMLHPYDVPEIIALPLVAGHAPYLQWVIASTARRST